MKISFVTRATHSLWGGDIKALQSIKDGLEHLGHQALFIPMAQDVPVDSDFVFLTNTCLDLNESHKALKGRHFGVVCFHEDFKLYLKSAYGMHCYIQSALRLSDKELNKSLARLTENPGIIKWHSRASIDGSRNFPVLSEAKVSIANSHFEAKTLARDCSSANVKVVYWAPGIPSSWSLEENDEFLAFAGLNKKEYLLQVGRLEPRKNQLATLVACKDIEHPLVFIATKTEFQEYEKTLIELIQRVRKHRTLLIVSHLKSRKLDSLEIIQMPNGEKLSLSCLKSAYQHAKVHVHPAFYELPGYTYLESIYFNVPTIATRWASIAEYLCIGQPDPTVQGLVEYVSPSDIAGIKAQTEKLLYQPEDGMRSKPAKESLPLFKRTSVHVAQEILSALEKEI